MNMHTILSFLIFKLNGEYSIFWFKEYLMGFPGCSVVKNPSPMKDTWILPLGWEDPLEERHGSLLQYSCLENLHGWRSLVGETAIPLLGIHTEETRSERDMCTSVFIIALFIIARTWNQPRCPSADEWIRKLWYIYTMEYYSAIKKNSFESVLMRWIKLEAVIQSEVSQKDKDQYSILMHIYGI